MNDFIETNQFSMGSMELSTRVLPTGPVVAGAIRR
jgi:hypothetical protein